MIRLMLWLRPHTESPKNEKADIAYSRAMKASDGVIEKIRERAKTRSPFRKVLMELLMDQRPQDVALIADAFETSQEARIYLGPPNGRG